VANRPHRDQGKIRLDAAATTMQAHHQPVKRRRALLESNLPRDNRSEFDGMPAPGEPGNDTPSPLKDNGTFLRVSHAFENSIEKCLTAQTQLSDSR